MKPIHKNRKILELKYKGRPLERDTMRWYHVMARWILELPLFSRPGRRNAGHVRLHRVELPIENLPTQFDGCRILFIADMHLDGMSGLAERIIRIAERVEYDYCILGGDYSFGFDASEERMRQQVRQVVMSLRKKSRVFGVLGNHDEYRMAEQLNDLGVEILLNEKVSLERSGDKVYLVGVDDGFFYRAVELEEAGATIPDGAFKIILSHSPDLYRQAAQAGYALYLTGHTHGGQICLPGGITLITNAHVPRKMVKDSWEYNGMVGYTSYGAGTSIVPVRFFCPPEVALLILTKGDEAK